MTHSLTVRSATALLGFVILAALGACTGRQRPVSYSIGAQQAAGVVRSYAADWALVVSRRDREALRRIQAGDALRASLAQLQALDGTGGASPAAPRASGIKVFVAPSGAARSPAFFLALVTWTSPETYPEREVLEFQRASPNDPWRVELRARLINNTPPPAIVADRGGRAGTLDARRTNKLRFSGEQVVETSAATTATTSAPTPWSHAPTRWSSRGHSAPGWSSAAGSPTRASRSSTGASIGRGGTGPRPTGSATAVG